MMAFRFDKIKDDDLVIKKQFLNIDTENDFKESKKVKYVVTIRPDNPTPNTSWDCDSTSFPRTLVGDWYVAGLNSMEGTRRQAQNANLHGKVPADEHSLMEWKARNDMENRVRVLRQAGVLCCCCLMCEKRSYFSPFMV